MAIGSSGEIGKTFGTRADFASYEEYLAWFTEWREMVGPHLLNGYGSLHYPRRGSEPMEEQRKGNET